MQNRILGATPFKAREAAEARMGGVGQSMVLPVPPPSPAFENLLSTYAKGTATLETQIIRFGDDQSHRLSLSGPDYQFLPPMLTVKQVEEVAGRPEKETTEVLQT